MAMISLRQLLDHAAEFQYGVPAFNVNNMEQLIAVMQAAKKVNSPVILQASRGARAYAGDAMIRHMILAAVEIFPEIPICMHQDHGDSTATCFSAIQNGFTSVMMDGSLKNGKEVATYEYNADITGRVAVVAHELGVSVEGELGVLGSLETGEGEKEDGHGIEGKVSLDKLVTDPDQALDFVKRTEADALAVAIGTSHGAYKFTRKPDGDILSIETVKKINEKAPNLHMVMHGASSVPEDLQEIINKYGGNMPTTFGTPVSELQRAIKYGVRKINIDTDCRMAMTGQLRRIATEHKAEFDLRKFMKPAGEAMQKLCEQRYQEFGSDGQASKIKPISLSDMAARYASGELKSVK